MNYSLSTRKVGVKKIHYATKNILIKYINTEIYFFILKALIVLFFYILIMSNNQDQQKSKLINK